MIEEVAHFSINYINYYRSMINEKEKVDREKVDSLITQICPFFLRLLWKENGTHPIAEYKEQPVYGSSTEYHLYTWLDASLRELVNVAKSIIPVANRKDAKIIFYHVYQDTSGRPDSEKADSRKKRSQLFIL